MVLGLWPLRSGAAPQSESLVDRSAAYVERFLDAYTNVVAEEAYTQERSAPRGRRTLRSDVVLVRYPGSNEWRVFRDVFEVDGNLIRDPREERLMKLFLTPASAAVPRAQAIAAAGAQHNIQDIGNLNNPLLAMSFLQRRYGERFRFTPGGRERKLGPAIREIRFEETHVPTLFRRGGNLDLPAHGVYWADEATGLTLQTRFGYAFETPPGSPYPPILRLQTILPGHFDPETPIVIDGAGGPIKATPFEAIHGRSPALGFRIGGLAYLPDANIMPDSTWPMLEGLEIFIVDALRYTPHPTHANLETALEWIERARPRRAVLTNMHVDLDYETLAAETPEHITPAYDGMVLELPVD